MSDRRGSRPGLTVKNTACKNCGRPVHFQEHLKTFGRALDAGLQRSQIRQYAPLCDACMTAKIQSLIPTKE